jgi:hypothetical protein
LLGELRLLDDSGKFVRDRKIAKDYLSRRLLGTQTSLSPRLDIIRQIAWQFALDDADRKNGYINNVNSLSLLVARRKALNTREWFHEALPSEYQEHGRQCDLLTASVCTGRLVTLRKLSERKELMLVDDRPGLLGDPYTAAAFADDFALIDHLLCQSEKQGLSSYNVKKVVTERILPAACEFASPKTVETLLTSPWCSFLTEPGFYSGYLFQRRLATPNLDTFSILRRFTHSPCDRGLATLLFTAVGRGWEEMTHRLIELGALVDDDWVYGYWKHYRISNRQKPLLAACKTGSRATVARLLQSEAKIVDCEIGHAARRGQFGMVKALIEYGADVNHQDSSIHPPLVSAILLEHVEMFRFLLERGAILGDKRTATIQKVKEHGLDSMLELMESILVEREEA